MGLKVGVYGGSGYAGIELVRNDTTCNDTTSSKGPLIDIIDIIDDPVGYLAVFGIDAELVVETTLPAAA